MKSITIHGVDEDLDRKLAEKSREYGLSQNRTIKKLLSQAVSPDSRQARRKEFEELLGIWAAAEKSEFDGRVRELDAVNESDWTP